VKPESLPGRSALSPDNVVMSTVSPEAIVRTGGIEASNAPVHASGIREEFVVSRHEAG
jgi:hypothetical protein